MSRGHSYDYIHLLDDTGKEVELPFLELDEELWDPAMKRLTLFIDPGRIKRGVRPLEEVGPSLQEGKRFTLVIDREWKDATELTEGPSSAATTGSRTGAPDEKFKRRNHTRDPLTILFRNDGYAWPSASFGGTDPGACRWNNASEMRAPRGRADHCPPAFTVVLVAAIEDHWNNIGGHSSGRRARQRHLTSVTANLSFEVR
jgi:hypothetical protein